MRRRRHLLPLLLVAPCLTGPRISQAAEPVNFLFMDSDGLFNRYKGKLSIVAMAVQQPTLTYRNPATGQRFTHAEFLEFARDYLGVDVIFWSVTSPWLRTAR
jgi:hypothetical protein